MSNTQPTPDPNLTVAELLAAYADYIAMQPSTPETFQQATTALSGVFDRLTYSPNLDDMTTVWNFFVANQYSIVEEQLVFRGIGVLSPEARFRYTFLYAMFRQSTSALALTSADMMAGVILNCPLLIQFLQAQTATASWNESLVTPILTYNDLVVRLLTLPTSQPTQPGQLWWHNNQLERS